MTDRKQYAKDYADKIRRTRKPGHQDCEIESCCYDGRRNYNRIKMQNYRAAQSNKRALAALATLRRVLRKEIAREMGIG